MKEQILKILKANHIDTFLINEVKTESVEVFFIKQKLDMNRMKDVTHINITLYKDFEKEGKKMRGSATANLYQGMNDEEIERVIKETYYATSFVNNAYYTLPKGNQEEKVTLNNGLSGHTLEESVDKLTAALFKYDTLSDTFMNSSELFVEKVTVHIINSEGVDVAYEKYRVKGEFVIQCIAPQDVETYHDFYYEDLACDELAQKVKEAIEVTALRSQAQLSPKTGKYHVILSGEPVATLLGYYVTKASSAMIYPGYSHFKLGDEVQGKKILGDHLSITLKANSPYSNEGIKMQDQPLLENGILKTIHGASRFAHYLGIEPTGTYDMIEVAQGSKSLEEMNQEPYLEVLIFSDFQIDSFTGDFGGEIRLALYYDGDKLIPLTGGSISGNIGQVQENFLLSTEQQIRKGYKGPRAISLQGIMVAGE